LKQADVVLALFLQGENFTIEEKRRDFDFYDPITTGDSSLSMCVQSIVASQVGYERLSLDYFFRALYLDLMNLHGNTSDGIHVASTGGVWSCVVYGFAGFFDGGEWISFKPRLPKSLGQIFFNLVHHSSEIEVGLSFSECTVKVKTGDPVRIRNGEKEILLQKGETTIIQRYEIPREVEK
jgi:alpha,alpha-trehalose phosphorylase